MWSVIFSVVSVLTAASSLVLALWSVRIARAALESSQAAQGLPASQLRSLRDSIEELTQNQLDFANRLKMTKVRAATRHADRSTGNGEEPDARTDPEAWRAWKNAQLRTGVFNS